MMSPKIIANACPHGSIKARFRMLAAREQELGTCWIGLARDWFNRPAIKKELKLPEKYQVVAPIVLGHPKQWSPAPARNPVEIHWVA